MLTTNTTRINELQQYQQNLAVFERQYQMTSEQFECRFSAGELGDDAVWFEWAFALDVYREVVHQFELSLEQCYQRYRQGEISFGRLAQEMGITSWELNHLLDERGWPVYNLPSVPGGKPL
jgi:hypothetical protein